MQESELVAKIKKLKQIRPERAWVLATKTQISGKRESLFSFNWLINRVLFVLPVIVVLLAVVFVYNRNITKPQVVSLDPETLAAITTGLRTAELGIQQISADLGKVNEPKKVAEIKNTVGSTIESGEKLVTTFKKFVKKPAQESQTLAALSRVEDALGNLDQTYADKQKEMAKQLIQDLEGKELTSLQKSRLEEAKTYYNNGDFGEALIKAIDISQVR